MKRCFVGIDTSNYTTSCAACDEEGKILANVRIPLPVKDGERGLRQSDAVFAHLRNLPEAMDALREVLVGWET
ncbi:MAG: O-sialoglycoprotein endopeptidase, partial [Clostridia bacterium]|nr:O-sialoglycoprotein endopeptidase [Clostridia bacterium]